MLQVGLQLAAMLFCVTSVVVVFEFEVISGGICVPLVFSIRHDTNLFQPLEALTMNHLSWNQRCRCAVDIAGAGRDNGQEEPAMEGRIWNGAVAWIGLQWFLGKDNLSKLHGSVSLSTGAQYPGQQQRPGTRGFQGSWIWLSFAWFRFKSSQMQRSHCYKHISYHDGISLANLFADELGEVLASLHAAPSVMSLVDRDLGGDEGWGHISTTIIILLCNTIASWHDGEILWCISPSWREICQMPLFDSGFSTTRWPTGWLEHFFSTIFLDVKNGCLTTPGADSGRLWEVFQKPHLFCPFGWRPFGRMIQWVLQMLCQLCQLCDSEVEIDGFFSLPHARESRFSSDSVTFWREWSCCTILEASKVLQNSQGET